MALDTFMVVANTYDDVDDAIADYDEVRDVWKNTDLGDTFDAAVVTHREDGRVKIVRHHEQPTIQGSEIGLGVGLAVGALVALFPAVGIGAGLLVGGASGLGLGALAGHVVGGMSRGDLKDLGERLDAGQSGILVVAAQDTEEHIDRAITRGQKILKKQMRADAKSLKSALDEAAKQ
jgi:uncharacterized membrane protein